MTLLSYWGRAAYLNTMAIDRIAVIGAGPSGITALKNLLDQGLDALAFDANDRVGGNWIYREDDSHSSVFETTHIISSRQLSEYGDYPWSVHNDAVADYPSHRELADYFQGYARHFGLEAFIRFGTRIQEASPVGENAAEGWLLRGEGPEGPFEAHFSHLVVANGHHWDPRWPDYPGTFSGQLLHSHHYKKAEPFRDKRVLVIGGGNSACDVAVETSRVSARTDISWRRGYRIVPKFVFGQPSDLFAARMAWLPIGLRTRMSALMLRVLNGPNRLYGLQEPDHAFGETHPTVNDELLYRIRHGKVHPRVDVQRLDGDTVHFADGSRAPYDTIIACTGYHIRHPFLEQAGINFSTGPVRLYHKMLHPDYRSLYFIGLFQPLGCIWPLAELQAKIMAREISGSWKRPADMALRLQRRQPHYKQLDTPRHTITVDYHAFTRELLRELPRDWRSSAKRVPDAPEALSTTSVGT